MSGTSIIAQFSMPLKRAMCSSLGYSGTKFEVATANGLGEDAFTRKYII